MSEHVYLVALGSNQRHHRFGSPRELLQTAIGLFEPEIGSLLACSQIITSAPIGPSLRQYANGAVVLGSTLAPQAMLEALLDLEQTLGRKRRGQRWRSRSLDLDIVLWDGGIVAQPNLQIPHPLFREREFVLGPAAQIAPDWRDPVANLTLRQLHARLTRRRPLPR